MSTSNPGTTTAATSTDPGIVTTRVVDAPRALAFKAWTDPVHVKRWWGPNGFTTPVCTIDARPGGVFHYCMRSSEGHDYWGKGVYREIVAPERIAYTDTFSDEHGNVVEATHYGLSAEWPRETLVTVTLAEHQGKTRVTLQHAVGSAPVSEREMCEQGWTQMLDRLAEYAPAMAAGRAE